MKTIYDISVVQATRIPDSIALLSVSGYSLNYGVLHRQVQHLIENLRRCGVGQRDVVAVVMPNGLQMARFCFAACCGAVCAPLNPEYRADEFEFHLRLLKATTLIIPDGMLTPATEAATQLDLRLLTLHVDSEGEDPHLVSNGVEPSTICDDGIVPSQDDIALVLHTSGTTAKPKLVPLTHHNICTTANNLKAAISLGRDDVCLSLMPQFHVGGLVDLLFAPLAAGGSVLCLPNFSAPHLASILDTYKPTWTQVVPTMLKAIVDTYSSDPEAFDPNRHLRVVRCVAAALPADVSAAFRNLFPAIPVLEVYGMTETATLITTQPLPPTVGKPGSVGRAAGPRVRVVDENGHSCAPSNSGEIVVAGANVMGGYMGIDNTDTFHGEWFRTGDWGYMDDDGDLFITGRIKEIINRSGEKISPAEVDEVLLHHPAIADTATFALPHPVFGEEVAAAIVVAQGQDKPARDEIISFLSPSLASFKIPRKVFYRDSIPRTPNGKVRRAHLAEAYQDIQDLAYSKSTSQQAPESQSALKAKLMQMWRKVLEIDSINDSDDFFDLGGDSLRAMTFISDLSEGQESAVFPTSLYDAPTISQFEQFLLTAHPALCLRLAGHDRKDATQKNIDESALPLAERTPAARHQDGLDDEDYDSLLAHTSTWQGHRETPHSLIVGLNIEGSSRPLFWCADGLNSIRQLALRLGEQQPLYGMRTGHNILQASTENIDRLSITYAEQVQQLQPQGPYLLGGFCQGGKIAFSIAQKLRQAGHSIGLLFLHEKLMPETLEVPVMLLFASHSQDNPLNHVAYSSLDLIDIYPGLLGMEVFEGNHLRWFEEPTVSHLAGLIGQRLEQPLSDEQESATVIASASEQVATRLIVADVRVTRRKLFSPGKPLRFKVSISNHSEFAWCRSGGDELQLGYFLYRAGDTAVAYTKLADINEKVVDGDSLTVSVAMTAPLERHRYRLEIRLLDRRQGMLVNQVGLSNRLFIYNSRREFIRRKIGDIIKWLSKSGR
ncbi:MAG: AMP-binding protein [Gammaproteobacteria bacterium]|nr:AMP-binding protein [Gammaproteobacteria bacterium]